MSKQEPAIKTPAELLAERITMRLVEKKLVHEGDAKKLQKAMAGGKHKAEDWRLIVEKAIDKEAADG